MVPHGEPTGSMRTHQSGRGNLSHRARITQTFTVLQTPRGELIITVPPLIVNTFGGKVGHWVWLAVKEGTVVITLRPWGPYSDGRRQSNKLRRIVAKRLMRRGQCTDHRSNRPNAFRHHKASRV